MSVDDRRRPPDEPFQLRSINKLLFEVGKKAGTRVNIGGRMKTFCPKIFSEGEKWFKIMTS